MSRAASWPVPNMQRRLEHPEPEGGGDVAVGLTSFDNVADMLEEFILQTVAPGRPDAAFVERRKRAGLDVALVCGCSDSPCSERRRARRADGRLGRL
jgi:hypothetical protein